MTPNRRIFLNIVATYVSPDGVARAAKRALCGVQIAVCVGDRLVLRAVDADGVGNDKCGLTEIVKNGKIYGKGMNAARQISRRFGRTTGARTRSASADCIVRG